MRHRTHVWLPLVLVAATVAAQDHGRAAPDALVSQLRTTCSDFAAQQGIVGMAVAVLRDGNVVFEEAFGHADREAGVRATTQTLFRLASVSKPVTAVLALQLVEQGKLDLDSPVGSRVEGLPAAVAALTVRQLLSHTSGIRHYVDGRPDNGTAHHTTREALRLFVDDPLAAPTGTKHLYSTHGYTLVAAALEAAGGTGYVDQLRTRVGAADLTTLDCEVAAEDKPLRTALYERRAKDGNAALRSEPREDLSWKYAGGGLEATALDVARFGDAVRTARLVKATSRDLMWTPVRLASGKATGYGLGWSVGDGGTVVSHTGSQQGTSTGLTILPEQGVVIAVLANTKGTDAHMLVPRLRAVLAAQQPAQTVAATAPTDLASLLEPLRAEFDLPALGGAVVAGGELVGLGVTGERARGSGVKVQVDDVWHLGSCTKAMTATLAARLVEQGKVAWDTTVGTALEGTPMIEGWRPVRLDWLLQNRGGMTTEPPRALWQELWERDEGPAAARAWFVGRLLARAPGVAPGTKFVYSNQGFNLAGVVLERRTGRTWEAMMQEDLFAPLGMTSAGFGAAGSATEVDQPRGHRNDGRTPVAPGKGADNPAAIGPAGTVHASLRDWARFVVLHLRGARGEQGLLLQPATFAVLHTAPEGFSYAMGWGTEQRPWAGGRALTHSGSNTMNYCTVWVAPGRDHAFLVVTNAAGRAAQQATDRAVGAMVRMRGLGAR